MTTPIVLIALYTLIMLALASADGIDCPAGTTPRGETTPDVSEAWCEVFKDGKTVHHGPYLAWWPNGKLGTKGQYEYGKPVGRWHGWYETGELQGEEWYENGKKVKSRHFDKKGNKIPK